MNLRHIKKVVNQDNNEKSFDGKFFVLGGDCRQNLCLSEIDQRYNVVKLLINCFELWKNCKV